MPAHRGSGDRDSKSTSGSPTAARASDNRRTPRAGNSAHMSRLLHQRSRDVSLDRLGSPPPREHHHHNHHHHHQAGANHGNAAAAPHGGAHTAGAHLHAPHAADTITYPPVSAHPLPGPVVTSTAAGAAASGPAPERKMSYAGEEIETTYKTGEFSALHSELRVSPYYSVLEMRDSDAIVYLRDRVRCCD